MSDKNNFDWSIVFHISMVIVTIAACIIAMKSITGVFASYVSEQKYIKENGTLIEETGIILDKHYTPSSNSSGVGYGFNGKTVMPVYGGSYNPEKYVFVLRRTDDNKVIDKKVSMEEYYNYEIGDEFVISSHYELERINE